jgi:hypothetical protein
MHLHGPPGLGDAAQASTATTQAGCSATGDASRVRTIARMNATVPSAQTARTWQRPFARSIAAMLIFAFIGVPPHASMEPPRHT